MSFKPEIAGSSLILLIGVVAGLLISRVPVAILRARPAEARAQTKT